MTILFRTPCLFLCPRIYLRTDINTYLVRLSAFTYSPIYTYTYTHIHTDAHMQIHTYREESREREEGEGGERERYTRALLGSEHALSIGICGKENRHIYLYIYTHTHIHIHIHTSSPPLHTFRDKPVPFSSILVPFISCLSV